MAKGCKDTLTFSYLLKMLSIIII